MGAYGNIEKAKAGLIYGLDYEIETRIVPSGTTFDFGDPVFVDEGDEEKGYKADSNNVSLKFFGIAVISQRSFVDSQGDYPEHDTMNVMTRGKVWVPVMSGVVNVANKGAYVEHDNTDPDFELFTDDSSGTYNTGCFFRSNAENGLCVLEVKGIK